MSSLEENKDKLEIERDRRDFVAPNGGWEALVCPAPIPGEKCQRFPARPVQKHERRFRPSAVPTRLTELSRRLRVVDLKSLPCFIVCVSLVEVLVHYGLGERAKRFFLYDADSRKEVWRFVTYMLLHTDSVHLGLNVVIQGFLGVPLECEQGHLRCAAVYFGGGLAGSLGASVFAASSPMAGASGGVYALLTSQIPNVLLSYETIKYAGPRILAVVALAASDFVYVYCHVRFYNNESPRIGWVAHVSGAVAGFLLGFLIFNGSSRWTGKLRLISSVLVLVPGLLALVHNLIGT